eukprot:459827-Pyramimonas_sp.AAC.1
MAYGESRMYLDTGAEGPTTNRLASTFATALPSLAEVAQEHDTHIMERLGRISFARLDRIYATMSTQDVLNHCPRSGTAWLITNILDPMITVLHHHFSDTLDLIIDPGALSGDLFLRLEEFKEVVRFAAQQVRYFISDRGAEK